MTTAGDFCNHHVTTAEEDEPVTEVARRMLDEFVQCAIVVRKVGETRKPLGVIREPDVMRALLGFESGQRAPTAGQSMSSPLVTFAETEPLEEALAKMNAFGAREVVIVDDDGGLVGLVSFDDYVELLAQEAHQLARIVTLEKRFEAKRRDWRPVGGRAERSGLREFARGRVVVLRPDTRLYDVVCALEQNHIGAVVAHDGERLVGIVTDRDIALRVATYELDPVTSSLGQVMTKSVAALEVTASVEDAIELMRHRHIRRVPLTEGSRVVGIVTLDDLIVARRIPFSQLADVVHAQLAEPSRHKDRGETHPGIPPRFN